MSRKHYQYAVGNARQDGASRLKIMGIRGVITTEIRPLKILLAEGSPGIQVTDGGAV
jgi:hypothetical protein